MFNSNKETGSGSKRRTVSVYILFGFSITVLSMVLYKAVTLIWSTANGGLAPTYRVILFAHSLQWLFGVVFSFICNKYFVFPQPGKPGRETLKQFGIHFASRIVVYFLEAGLLLLFTKLLSHLAVFSRLTIFTADFTAKILAATTVFIVNFLISRFIIFRENKAIPNNGGNKAL